MNWLLLSTVYLTDPEHGYVLVSLVEKKGSSYMQPGARMLVREDGEYWGSVSAGCLEDQVSGVARSCLRNQQNRKVTIDTRPYYGCFGEITLLFEVILDRTVGEPLFREIAEHMSARKTISIHTPDDDSGCGLFTRKGDEGEGLVELIRPVSRLIILGDWGDGMALSKQAGLLSWNVVLHDASEPDFDPEAIVASVEPDPWTAVMIMTHNLARDCMCLRAVLLRKYAYVGVIGSHKRREVLVEELANLEDPDLLEHLDGFRCPAGLNIGGDGPEAIALSVLAGIQAAFNDRDGIPLDELKHPIHQ
ncbi:MAG: XdhC family protein [Puniceicoccaceae bacterium]